MPYVYIVEYIEDPNKQFFDDDTPLKTTRTYHSTLRSANETAHVEAEACLENSVEEDEDFIRLEKKRLRELSRTGEYFKASGEMSQTAAWSLTVTKERLWEPDLAKGETDPSPTTTESSEEEETEEEGRESRTQRR